ncbi:MAG TPA: hypothetical protein VFY93_06085 [Planctomycetota bacterium]|nr:hypothetical protein [Planctomycetota bacterium]
MKRTALPLMLAMLVACGGPKARIKDNQALYDTYPPEVQAMIKSGQIGQGFDQTQVYMALGAPEKKEMREGQEAWLYTVGVKRTLKHEKGAVEFENEQMKYEKALAEYNQAKAEGRVAVEPAKPDPYSYENQHRTRLRQEVVFVSGKVATARTPQDEYLDEWH